MSPYKPTILQRDVKQHTISQSIHNLRNTKIERDPRHDCDILVLRRGHISEEFNAIDLDPPTDSKIDYYILFVLFCCFWSLSRIFHSHRYVAIAGEGVQI